MEKAQHSGEHPSYMQMMVLVSFLFSVEVIYLTNCLWPNGLDFFVNSQKFVIFCMNRAYDFCDCFFLYDIVIEKWN